ncbi:lipopolysaccharide biosynthesis protein [Pectobacterium aquaticum]|uniref:lipopolysaccharide biosynthesis protein n=1 Tax=Pectobacterium aquaticum TaxID=2204145 RepID=UPI000E245D34|nr:oligosaccharide flippase family protein [Pectobacterium aquaticum]UEM38255.1 oligosaccharide flippase family protein [Pectobacterium aquaticum]
MNSKSVYLGILSNVVGNLLMLCATILLTRILTAEEFGQFRVGSNFSTLMIPFLALGGERLISRVIQSSGENKLPVSQALFTVLFIVLCGTFLLVVLYPVIAYYVLDGNVPASVYFLSVSIIPITITYNLANTIWRHIGSTSSAQIHLNFTQRLLRAPLLIGSVLLWPMAWSASLAMLLAQSLSLTQIRKNLQAYPLRGIGKIVPILKQNFKELSVIGLPIAIMASVNRLDVLLVNAVMGVDRAGSYDLVYMLSLTAMFPAMALSKTSEPFLFELKGDKERQNLLKKLQFRTFLVSCMAVIGIAVVAPFFADFLGNAGPDFAKATLALSAGLAFSSAHGPVIEYLQINEKSRLVLIATISLLSVFFILKYFSALENSLISLSVFAGLFYFSLRFVLSLYIRLSDGISMSKPIITIVSTLLYIFFIGFVFLG